MQDRSPNIRINGHSADRVSNVALSDQIVKNCQLACPFCSPVWDCIGRSQSERFRKLQNRAAHHNNKFWLYDLISYYIRFWLAGIRLKKGVLDSWGGGVTRCKLVNAHFQLRLNELFQTTFPLRPENVTALSRCYTMEQPSNNNQNPGHPYWL